MPDVCRICLPCLHVLPLSNAFMQVTQGAATLGCSLRNYLTALKDAGLGSLPGTAAEVLDGLLRCLHSSNQQAC